MALLSFGEELARARANVPFANGMEYESWASIWCDECAHFDTCPLILVTLNEKTPAAWQEIAPGALNRYHCHEFEQKPVIEVGFGSSMVPITEEEAAG